MASIVFVDPVVRLAQFLLDHIASRIDLHCGTVTLIATRLGHHPDKVHRVTDQGLGLGQMFGVIRGRREGVRSNDNTLLSTRHCNSSKRRKKCVYDGPIRC